MARRVLFVTTSTSIGGAEKTLHLLASRIDRARFAPVGAVCLKEPGPYAARLEESGVGVRSLGMGRLPSPRTLERLRSAILESRPELVHAFLYAASELCRAVRALGVPFRLISSPRVTYRTRGAARLAVDRLLRGQDDLLVAESEASGRFFVDSLGYPGPKVLVIRNGVDLERSRFSPRDRDVRRKALALSEDEVLLGCVGRLDPQKGQEVLLKALSKLPFKLALVGGGPDRPALERLAEDLGLGSRCVFVGEASDAGPWLSAFDILVHPSLWEGTPNAVMEAMAAGRAVVASRVDGIGEIVEDGVTGRLVPPGDADALAEAVAGLAADAKGREALGRRAAEEARRRFDLGAMIRAYEGAYERALA